jgi:hypothetical protein
VVEIDGFFESLKNNLTGKFLIKTVLILEKNLIGHIVRNTVLIA